MKKIMPTLKKLAFSIGFCFVVTANSWAQPPTELINIKTYVPSPFSVVTQATTKYLKFSSVDKTAFESYCTTDSADTMALSTDSQLMFCDGTGTVVNLPGVWIESSNGVRLSDGTKNVGIGTSTPAAKLHVYDGSLLVEGAVGAIPATGVGTRMMWYPAKAAFRAGAVTGTQWDDAQIGLRSAVLGGTDNTAAASNSAAIGGFSNTIASAARDSVILGGTNNTINNKTGAIVGGVDNTISSSSTDSAILNSNSMTITGDYVTSIGRGGILNSSDLTVSTAGVTIIKGDQVGVNNNSPSATLDVNGLVVYGNPNQKRYPVGMGQETYMVTGSVDVAGALVSSNNNSVTSSKLATGFYVVDYNALGFTSNPNITVTPVNGNPVVPLISSITTSNASINFNETTAGGDVDSAFSFIVTGTLGNTTDGMLTKDANQYLPYTP